MTHELSDKRVAFLTANEGVEQVELTHPWNVVEAAGGRRPGHGARLGTCPRPFPASSG